MKHAALAVACMSIWWGLAAAGGETGGPFQLDSDEFPIGMYSIDGPGAMAQAESLGIDYVQSYATGGDDAPEAIQRNLTYLDLAQKHGRRVAFQLAGPRLADRPDGVEAMCRIMESVKDHPALGFWIFYDEPDGRHTPEQLVPFYQAAKQTAPKVPFALCFAWTKHIADYKNVADLTLNDYYPVQHETFPESPLNLMSQFTKGMLAIGLPVMPINQCFNWQAIGQRRNLTEFRNSPVDQMRFPNQAELRYLCYSGLAQGVRGMFWWSYYWARQSDAAWLGREFAPVSREFRDFTRLVKPAHCGEIISTGSSSGAVLATRWDRPSGEYWVVVNQEPTERPLVIDTKVKDRSATLTPWGSTRQVDAMLRGGVLTVPAAQPWEVFVWHCAP